MCSALNEVLEPPKGGDTTSVLHIYSAWALTEVSSDTGRVEVSEFSTSKIKGQGNAIGR